MIRPMIREATAFSHFTLSKNRADITKRVRRVKCDQRVMAIATRLTQPFDPFSSPTCPNPHRLLPVPSAATTPTLAV